MVLAGSEDSAVWMWNADNGSYLNLFSGHGGRVSCGDFTPDGKQLLFNLMLSLFFLQTVIVHPFFTNLFEKLLLFLSHNHLNINIFLFLLLMLRKNNLHWFC